MSDVIASGTVTVRELHGSREWDEIVEVFERDMNEAADEVPVEDIARRVAQNQALPRRVKTLEVDLS